MKDLIILGRVLTFISFLIGTTLFSLFLYFDQSDYIGNIGFYFTIIAFILNAITFFILLIASAINETYREELLKTCGLLLLNIPVAILYVYLLSYITIHLKG